MSEESYQKNVQRGVTGSRTQTCFPASFDRISEKAGVSPQSYEQYTQLRHVFIQACGDYPDHVPTEIVRQFTEARKAFCRDLGVETLKSMNYYRADTESDLRQTLGRLANGGFRISVFLDVGGLHAVGVTREDEEHYTVKSTWTPFSDEVVSIGELHEYLDPCPRLGRNSRQKAGRYAKTSNIATLPPERKR